MKLRGWLLLYLVWATQVSAQGLSGGASLPRKEPQTAQELVELRRFYDQTVWQPEVDAQRHETYFTKLWDRLIHEPDKYRVLADAAFDRLIVGTEPSAQLLDWGIERLSFPEGKREISAAQWLGELDAWQRAGYQLIESEFHHSEYDAKEGGPARSKVAMVLHVTHPATQRRFVVKGDLMVTWRAGTEPIPAEVDATGLTVLQRQGTPAFAEAMRVEYVADPQGREHKTTIHPVMVYDLNDDGLPELILGGENRVYWNRGGWKFDMQSLCRVDPGHVNAAALADFDGDGVVDYLAAVKNGFPRLYRGAPGGKFEGEPEELKFTSERLRVPVSVAVGDIDGDADLDVYIGQQKPAYNSGDIPTPYYDALDSFPGYLLVNDGKGGFRDVTATSGLSQKRLRRNFSASFVDLDADSDLDLLLTSDFSGSDILLNDGQGTFTDATQMATPRPAAFGMSHTFGDYDLDGRLDFMTIGMSSTTARRLARLNLGRSEFPDYNEERMNMGYGNRMFLRTDQGFEQAAFNASVARTGWSWGSTTLDFDNDSDQDVYVVNGQTSGKTTQDYCTRFWCHDVYYKRGERPDKAIKDLFTKMGPVFSGNSISWNGFEHNALLMNRAGQDFVNVGFLMDVASELDSRAAASGDFDGDGRIDLVFEHFSTRDNNQIVFLLKNQWDVPHHWIGVRLGQRQGTASPIGAVVTAHLADGRKLLQHHVLGHSVWAQHDHAVHFGLGTSDQVQRLEIRWPNGRTSALESPATDQYHVVVGD